MPSKLNEFFSRFDTEENNSIVKSYGAVLTEKESYSPMNYFSLKEVEKCFMNIKTKKSKGPDNIPGRVLKFCCQELTSIFCYIFNMSVNTGIVPNLWKVSNIVPIAKNKNALDVNDFRPVALTCTPAKCLEKLILQHLMKIVDNKLDPMQFAYKKHCSTSDALSTMIHKITSHLDRSSSNTSRALFLDFSSAFNTIPPVDLVQKLSNNFQIPDIFVKWIFNFLTNRTQYVTIAGESKSKVVITNIGSPQGCILSPFLFCAYTDDLRSSNSNIAIVKYADDTLIIGNITNKNDEHYHTVIRNTISWCTRNKLILNASKTKELIFDFRKEKHFNRPVTVHTMPVEQVDHIKYLGCFIDNKFLFNKQADYVLKKAAQRRFLVYKLYSFNINPKLVSLAYTALVRSVITYCLSIYYYLINNKHKRRLTKIFEKCQHHRKLNLQLFLDNSEINMMKNILKSNSHPLKNEFVLLPSGRRLAIPFTRTTRFSRTFVPHASATSNNSRH